MKPRLVRPASIVSAAEADRTTTPGRSALDLGVEAAAKALDAAGLEASSIDGIYTGYSLVEPELDMANRMAQEIGVSARLSGTLSVGGATGAALVQQAAIAVEAHAADVVLVVWADNRASGVQSSGYLATISDQLNVQYEVPYGPLVSTQYALIAQRHMHKYGTTSEDLAAVAVAVREHAGRNPAARFRMPINIESVLESPMIASPLHRLDCCLITDFGGAAIITTERHAAQLVERPVSVLGYGQGHSYEHLTQAKDLTMSGAVRSGTLAFDMAGVGVDEIDLLQLYDCFTITVLIELEDLGFCAKGDAGAYVREGHLGIDSRHPANTNGGMLSCANGGILHVTEAVLQLQGLAGEHQLADRPELALVHGNGGMLASHVTLVLGAA